MANSIRTPRLGNNPTSRRIAEAVDDEEWQEFRVSLKGKSTKDKLRELKWYFEGETTHVGRLVADVQVEAYSNEAMERDLEDIRIRVDNYLKALARGGQIAPSVSYLSDLIEGKLVIRK